MDSILDKYCGSEFWNNSLTWDTDDPELTKCFEKTVLVWIPCIFLWIFSPLEVCYIINSKRRDIPWSWLNISKLAITAVLCILALSDLTTSFKSAAASDSVVPSVDIFSPLIKLLSIVSIISYISWTISHTMNACLLFKIYST